MANEANEWFREEKAIPSTPEPRLDTPVHDYLKDSHIDFVDDTSGEADPAVIKHPEGKLPRPFEKIIAKYAMNNPEATALFAKYSPSATEVVKALPVYALASLLTQIYYKGPTGRLEIAKEKIADQKSQIKDLKGDNRSLANRIKSFQAKKEQLKQLEDIESNVNNVFYNAFLEAGFNYDPDMLKNRDALKTALGVYVKRAAQKQLNMDPAQVRAHMLTTLAAYDRLGDTDVALPLDELIAKAQTVEQTSEKEFLRIIRPVFINAVTEDPDLKEMFEKEGVTDFNKATAPQLRAASVDALIYLSNNLAEAREAAEAAAKQAAEDSILELAKDLRTNHPGLLSDQPVDSSQQAASYIRQVAGFAEQVAQTLEARDQNSDLIAYARELRNKYATMMQFEFNTVETREQAITVLNNYASLAQQLKDSMPILMKSTVAAHLAGANSTRDRLRSELDALTAKHRHLQGMYERTDKACKASQKFNAQRASDWSFEKHRAENAEATSNILEAQKNDLEGKLASTATELTALTQQYNTLTTQLAQSEKENSLLTGAMQDALRTEAKTRASNTILRHERNEAVKTADTFDKAAAATGRAESRLLDTQKDLYATQAALFEKEQEMKEALAAKDKAYAQLFADRNSDPAFHQLRAHYNGFWNGVATADKVEPLADEIYKLAIQHGVKPAELVKLVEAARKKFGDGGIPELIHDELISAIPKKNLKTVL